MVLCLVLGGVAAGRLQNGKEGRKGAWQCRAPPAPYSAGKYGCLERGSWHLGNLQNLSTRSLVEAQEIGTARNSSDVSLLGSEASYVVKERL